MNSKRGFMKKFALVLGGGAAKGYAHIGILKVLEKNGLKPDLIVGTSIGALVGGIYASGKTIAELEDLAAKFNGIGTFSLYSALFKDNLLNVDKIKRLINKAVGDITHEQAPIKFVSVSTELNTGKEKYFSTGLLRDSIMASISIPGVFPRFKVGENLYCDGGLLNNLPEDVAREMMPDAVVVSVDVIGDYEKQVEHCRLKTIETIINASTLMTQNNVKHKPQMADLRIAISQPHISQMGFNGKNAKKSINKGVNFGKRYISTIKKLLNGEKHENN